MPADTPNRYTAVVDLTSRAQREAKREEDLSTIAEPEDALPEADLKKLPKAVKAAAKAAGWKSLMPVQQKAIPYVLEGRDLIVQSRTGSGKTGAFLLPLFERLDPDVPGVQALILTPTRELARQIHAEFERMQHDGARFESVLVYGGVKYGPQTQALQKGVPVVIGTPGRILDHLERRTFRLDNLRMLVLDEADEMLSMGFYPAMLQLRRYLPRERGERTSYMFSATMPPKVRSLAREFLHEPGFLSLSVGQVSVDAIEHRYYLVDPMQKDRTLVRLIELNNPDSAIIFANTKREVEYLAQFLKNYGYDADEISGDLTQTAREAVMDRIRKGELRFLVATDVAARGIDISDLSHVFMYDVPQDPEYYVHRAGRTARAGKTGVALVFTTAPEERVLLSIARHYEINLQRHDLPSDEDVEGRVAERMTERLEDAMRQKTNLEKERLKRFVPLVKSLAAEEPELLAMLVDEVYHRHLHAPAEGLAAEPAPKAERVEKRPSGDGGRGRGRGRGRGQNRGRHGGGRRGNS